MPKNTNHDYIIRLPELSDVESIISLHTQSWLDAYPNDENDISREYIAEYVKNFSSDEGHERRRGYVDEAHANPDYYFRIACNENGEVIGFVDARRNADGGELSGLYIARDYYGKGLGHALAGGALEWLGNKTITLHVVRYNERAKKFYAKLGFKEVPGTERLRKETNIPIIDMVREVPK